MKKEILRMEHVSTQDSALSNLDDFNMNLFQGETAAIVKLNDVGVDKLMEILCYNRPISSGRIYIGEQLVNQGRGMDDAKDALWDLYLDAVGILEDRKGEMGTWQLRNEDG